MSQRDDVMKKVLMMTAAGLTGATLGLLFAPQTGARTRRDLKRFGGNLARDAQEFQEDLRDRLDEMASECKHLGSQSMEKGAEARDEVVKVLRRSRDLIADQIQKVNDLFR